MYDVRGTDRDFIGFATYFFTPPAKNTYPPFIFFHDNKKGIRIGLY